MILNGKTFNPGELRTRITIQSRSVSVETGGFPAAEAATLAEVWAKWENAHGSEVWAAESVQAVDPATVTVRYLAGVDRSCTVLKGSQVFEVVSVDDIGERHEYMELKVRRLEAG